jgi:hypothetical protein
LLQSWPRHCNATDQQPYWVSKRQAKKAKRQKRQRNKAHSSSARTANSVAVRASREPRPQNSSAPPAAVVIWKKQKGPLEPGHPQASTDNEFAKCGKCGWHSRLNHDPWCLKCGLVVAASKESFSHPAQSDEYKPNADDIYFGTRHISFRIVPRDVRSIPKYKGIWNQQPQAADSTNNPTALIMTDENESEMQEDVFRRRLGPQPTIESILRLASMVEEVKLKEMTENWNSSSATAGTWKTKTSSGKKKICSERVLEAITLEDCNDLALLRLLLGVHSFGKAATKDLVVDITATWDKENLLGVRTSKTDC